MDEFYKKHKRAIIITLIFIVLLPIAINFIAICPSYFPNYIAGTQQSVWMNFFAVYCSSLIGAFVSFFILYKTIEENKRESIENRNDNHIENENNRKRLESVVKYQKAKDDYYSLKEKVVRFCMALNNYELHFIPLYCRKNKEEGLFRIKDISQKLAIAYELLDFNLNDYDDEVAIDYKKFIKDYYHEASILIGDILWIIDYWLCEGTDEQNRNMFVEKTNRYKEIAFDKKFKRIWHYVIDHDFKIKSDGESIINERINDFDFIIMRKKSLEFCDSEKNRVKNLLEI